MPIDGIDHGLQGQQDDHGAEHETAAEAKDREHKESAGSCKADGVSPGECRANGHDAASMKEGGYDAGECKEAGFSADQCKEAGFSAGECKGAGFSAGECKEAGFDAGDCKDAGFNADQCKDAGFSAGECKDAGFSAGECKSAGFSAGECKDAGFNAGECKEAGFSAGECKGAGFSAGECKEAGFNASQCKEAGFEVSEMKEAGFNAQEMYDAGFTASQMRGGGFSYGQILHAAINHFLSPTPKSNTPVDTSIITEAQKLVNSGKVSFATIHASGIVDDATAQKNIDALKSGKTVLTSKYGDALGKAVQCDKSLLEGLNKLAEKNALNISEIAGGDHSTKSPHYNCKAVDINVVNGKHVGDDPQNDKAFRKAAEDAGFKVLGPGDKGHGTHFHLSL